MLQKSTCAFAVMLLLWLLTSELFPNDEITKITPAWVKENPGRLEFSKGSAFNGSNGFTFRLLSDEQKRFSVTMRVEATTDGTANPLCNTIIVSGKISKSVVFNTSLWPNELIDVSFHILEETPLLQGKIHEGDTKSHEYEIHLQDFAESKEKLPSIDFDKLKHAEQTAFRLDRINDDQWLPLADSFEAYWLTDDSIKSGEAYGPVLLLARTTLEQLKLRSRLKFEAETLTKTQPALLLESAALTIETYKKDSIWNEAGRPIKEIGKVTDVNERNKTITIEGRQFQFEKCRIKEALQLLDNPSGTISLHRKHGPLAGATKTAKAIKLLLKDQLESAATPEKIKLSADERKLLSRYRGDLALPDPLLRAYSQFAKAAQTATQANIKKFILPNSVTISTATRAKNTAYGTEMNVPFLRSAFQPQILNLRKESEHCYLIRTGTSWVRYIKTASNQWKIFDYGDKPIE